MAARGGQNAPRPARDGGRRCSTVRGWMTDRCERWEFSRNRKYSEYSALSKINRKKPERNQKETRRAIRARRGGAHRSGWAGDGRRAAHLPATTPWGGEKMTSRRVTLPALASRRTEGRRAGQAPPSKLMAMILTNPTEQEQRAPSRVHTRDQTR